jgi:protein tyrosine phosphatase
VPETTRPIRELVHLMNTFRQIQAEKNITGPAFVHCSAGIGTSFFLSLWIVHADLFIQNVLEFAV